jgi:hypothetical protein
MVDPLKHNPARVESDLAYQGDVGILIFWPRMHEAVFFEPMCIGKADEVPHLPDHTPALRRIGHAGDAPDLVETEPDQGCPLRVVTPYRARDLFDPDQDFCPGFSDLEPHPNVNLQSAPLGPYVDGRSRMRRVWCLVRFWWLYFVWRVRVYHDAVRPAQRPA